MTTQLHNPCYWKILATCVKEKDVLGFCALLRLMCNDRKEFYESSTKAWKNLSILDSAIKQLLEMPMTDSTSIAVIQIRCVARATLFNKSFMEQCIEISPFDLPSGQNRKIFKVIFMSAQKYIIAGLTSNYNS